ncbi:hypothetical protein M9H77_35388 [Catharanthus roseus]|uniref:Uncharacterized protein n=1 Tax=Catharanthus roseus TaxID=4058 RepID=A0ACB9ZP71_CATRO|nr:hypothetical protein M9H77_35388 [Catharanthus roseus]
MPGRARLTRPAYCDSDHYLCLSFSPPRVSNTLSRFSLLLISSSDSLSTLSFSVVVHRDCCSPSLLLLVLCYRHHCCDRHLAVASRLIAAATGKREKGRGPKGGSEMILPSMICASTRLVDTRCCSAPSLARYHYICRQIRLRGGRYFSIKKTENNSQNGAKTKKMEAISTKKEDLPLTVGQPTTRYRYRRPKKMSNRSLPQTVD